MDKPEISLILPSIRTERLEKLYETILTSTKRTFELVICGPNPLPEALKELRNVKYVKDYGSPVRAPLLQPCTAPPADPLHCTAATWLPVR